MIRFWAIIENTIKEGIAKKTILTIFVLTTIIIGFFLIAIGATEDALFLFGQEIDELPEQAVREAEGVVIGFFYQVAIFIGIFAIASFYPSMQDQGTIDLLLSRPMSRFNIFLAKFIGCMLVVFSLVAYLILGTWIVIYLKTGVTYTEYLLTIPIFMLIFFSFMAFTAMVGIISRSTATSAVLAIFFPYIFSAMLSGFHEAEVFSGLNFWGEVFEWLYKVFPKTPELMDWNIQLVRRGELYSGDLMFAIWSTIGFSVFCYGVGTYIFQKRSY
jgi:ABC-type transport system involved in multi-copper enzyme maturation permease subunit